MVVVASFQAAVASYRAVVTSLAVHLVVVVASFQAVAASFQAVAASYQAELEQLALASPSEEPSLAAALVVPSSVEPWYSS